MSSPRIAVELIDHILDDVADDPDAAATLKACSYANSTLCGMSQKRLFRDLKLDFSYYLKNPEATSTFRQEYVVCERRVPRSRGRKFLDLVQGAGEDGGRFLKYVETLTILLSDTERIEKNARESNLATPRLLPLLPNLKKITFMEPLSILELREFNARTANIPWDSLEHDLRSAFLRAFQAPLLKELNLGRVTDLPVCFLQLFSGMLDSLVISTLFAGDGDSGSSSGPGECPNCDGECLVYKNQPVSGRTSIKRLRFDNDFQPEREVYNTVEQLRNPHFPIGLSRLTSLEIASSSRNYHMCFDPVLEMCSKTLEHLHMQTTHSVFPYVPGEEPNEDLISSFCDDRLLSSIPNLRSFSIEFIIYGNYSAKDDQSPALRTAIENKSPELQHSSPDEWLALTFICISFNTWQAGCTRPLDELTVYLEINFAEYDTLPRNWLKFMSIFRTPVMPKTKRFRIEIHCLREPKEMARNEMARLLWENEDVQWLAKEGILTVTAKVEENVR
ncbi:hypothetical protein NLJ89_g5757 [Agrocybe chaxingu]|uniref:Uncharacterized protein n=1 Tax=Agrocybe chaxingu TaxID=84603 RepID=A0A9W8MUQ9_9AGAR|nr:hypothetical protein NLJ89_g5757 [Agrocybe chaxingu]